jgi:8-amino-7-oxononanoate synthase
MAGVDRIAREELSSIEARGRLRNLEPQLGPSGPEIELDGPRGPERLVNWSSNDYLGLAADPRISEALAAGARRWGTGAGASRLVTGDFACMQALERELAEFEGAQAALLFNSGTAANLGLVPALVGEGDVVCSDARNHASLIDGCRLSGARVVVYPHRDTAALQDALEDASRAGTGARRRLVVTDSIFSMDGDAAPLAEIARICTAREALLVVDEAHATGVVGPRGAGLVAELGLAGQVDARMATLSKAVGVVGAHVCGSHALRELLVNLARTLIFSTALPPALAEAARVALGLLSGEEGETLRSRLRANVRALSAGLGRLGVPSSPAAAILPVILGSPARALAVAAELRRRGHLVKAIRPPSVAEGTSRLRIAASAAHTPEQVESLIAALTEVI